LIETLGLRAPTRSFADIAFLALLAGGCAVGGMLGWYRNDSVGQLTVMAAFAAIVWQPLIEELLFRGVLQGELLKRASMTKRLLGLTAANVITSLAFVAIHFVNHPYGWAIAVFAPSLVFGWGRERFDSIYGALLLHCAYNASLFGGALVSG
jgi:membrane protease YdiL (CAAX protease family)